MSKQERLSAKHYVPGSPAPRLGVDVEHWLDIQQAATALALALAKEPMVRTAQNTLQQGLNRAMSARLLEDEAAVASVSQVRVDGYRAALNKHKEFFFKPGNVRLDDGKPVTRVEVRHLFTLDEAATALALVYAGETLPRWGKNTVIKALRQAAQERLLDDKKAVAHVDQDAADEFRTRLLMMVPEFLEFETRKEKEQQQG